MFSGRIQQCYDSHVHWLATGETHEQLKLNNLRDPHEVKTLKIETQHQRGPWILGFGWDQNLWTKNQFPHREILDSAISMEQPVAFSRADGHALWVNTQALRVAQLLENHVEDPVGGKIVRDQNGTPTGVLVDTAMKFVDLHIPKLSAKEARRFLIKGMQIFNKAGFTHVRDLSCSLTQWEEAIKLEESGVLTLAVEQYFSVEANQTLNSTIQLAKLARQAKSRQLRVKGIKVFVDGALGSEGALLSHQYSSGSGHGLLLLPPDELEQTMREVWANDFELAVHTIGDEAAQSTLECYHHVKKSGYNGKLHLEHAELLRPETIKLMASEGVECHMQPCHWLSDHHWLEEKVGELKSHAFPWRALQEANIKFDFGSDSPIERPSLLDNLRALDESAESGIPRLLGDPLQFHRHSDAAWVPNCFTQFADGIPIEVVFNGENIS